MCCYCLTDNNIIQPLKKKSTFFKQIRYSLDPSDPALPVAAQLRSAPALDQRCDLANAGSGTRLLLACCRLRSADQSLLGSLVIGCGRLTVACDLLVWSEWSGAIRSVSI